MQYIFESPNGLNLPFECFCYEADKQVFPVTPHWHYFMEILYIVEGNPQVIADEKTYYPVAGDMILFFPKVVHGIYATSNNRITYYVMKFDVSRLSITTAYSPRISTIIEHAAVSPHATPLIRAGEIPDLSLEDLFVCCMNEMHGHRYGYDIFMQAKIYELLIHILRKWRQDGFIVDDRVPPRDDTYTINNITEYIDSHSGEDLSIESIAKMCHLSYSFFAKRFHEMYSRSCKEYIIRTRLRKVEELLVFTEHDLNYISQETGFSDCSHMIKAFKEYKGITPKQFRLQEEQKRREQLA